MSRAFLTRYAWLSIAAAVLTIGLKGTAYLVTGSVGLLSDALESLVNLAGGFMALMMLSVAARPADEEHAYGHSKAEYFSSGVEGTLILVAAVSIAIAAVSRLLDPRQIESVGLGLAISFGASLVNLGAAIWILRAGKKNNSITLQANAHHLFTDVWTSVGVIAGVGLVWVTGLKWLDPVIALLVAANIVWTGSSIVSKSVSGLMDTALEPEDRKKVHNILNSYRAETVQFHALRTRQAGARRFVSVHVLVPGSWTVHQGHELVERIEADIRKAVGNVVVFTHLESLDDPASWEDDTLDRAERPQASVPPG